jgi:hypothetical protein
MANDYVGADELEALLADEGISGDDDEDGVGDVIGDLIGLLKKKKKGLHMRTIVRRDGTGIARDFPLLMSAAIALADNGAATLTGTANRDCVLRELFVEFNDAGGARAFGGLVTSILVGGRNATVGAGFVPAALLFGEFGQTSPKSGRWNFGQLTSGNTAGVGVTNASGAAADVYAGFRAEVVD